MKKISLLFALFFLLAATKTYAIVGMQRPNSNTCDKIILTNGDTLQAKIVKVTNHNIIYKKCVQAGTSEISIAKKGVASVIYAQTNEKEAFSINKQHVFNVIVGLTLATLVFFALLILWLWFAIIGFI